MWNETSRDETSSGTKLPGTKHPRDETEIVWNIPHNYRCQKFHRMRHSPWWVHLDLFVFWRFYGPINTIKVIPNRSVNILKLFLDRLRPPERLTEFVYDCTYTFAMLLKEWWRFRPISVSCHGCFVPGGLVPGDFVPLEVFVPHICLCRYFLKYDK